MYSEDSLNSHFNSEDLFLIFCHLGSLCHLLLQVNFPSVTPHPEMYLNPHFSLWYVSVVNQHTYLYTIIYILLFCNRKYGHMILWFPRHAYCSSSGSHRSWLQALRIDINHQYIFSVALPLWSLQSSFHPCRAICVKTSHKYYPWNVW